jgi:hypothetical protein
MQAAQQSMNQDSQATKQAMEAERKRQEQKNEQLQNQLEQNKEFQNENQKMQDQGFQLMNKTVNAQTNNTGDFSYDYKNQKTGETAQIQGEMKDGKLNSMKNTNEIKQNQDYQDLKKKLEQMGFNQNGEPQIQGEKFISEFKNQKTGEMAKISGDFQDKPQNMNAEFDSKEMLQKILNNQNQSNQDLTNFLKNKFNKTIPQDAVSFNIQPNQNPQINNGPNQEILKSPVSFNSSTGKLLEKPDLYEKKKIWSYVLFGIGMLIAIIGLVLYFKYSKNKKPVTEESEKLKKIDYVKEAKRMLKEAIELFEDKKFKDAYSMASYALRYYYSYKLGTYKEFTSYETIKLLRQNKLDYKSCQECLDLCGLVEFAKYEPNKKDFDKIISIAQKLIE